MPVRPHILHPVSHERVGSLSFPAFGTADETEIELVRGEIIDPNDPSHPIPGQVLRDPPEWIIYFRVPAPGYYTLRVWSVTHPRAVAVARNVNVQPTHGEITYPQSSSSVCRNTFVAYGTCNNQMNVTGMMNNSYLMPPVSQPGTKINSPVQTNWLLSFTMSTYPLDSRYSLTVTETGSAPTTHNNITLDPACC